MPEIPLPEGVMKLLRPKTYERRQAFIALRETAIGQSKADLQKRLAINPTMTEDEKIMAEDGLYVEELEPQVREAVVHLRGLGYSTQMSGFLPPAPYHRQFIEMDNALSPSTKAALQAMKVQVQEKNLAPFWDKGRIAARTWIVFKPETPDLSAIKKKWDEITAVFPPSGVPLLPKPLWILQMDEAIELGYLKSRGDGTYGI